MTAVFHDVYMRHQAKMPFMFWEWMSCYIPRFYMVMFTYCRSRDVDLAKLLSYRGPWIVIGEIELKQT